MEKDKVIVVIPAFNEEGKIGKVVSAVLKEEYVDAILVVDDGSEDNTFNEAQIAGAKVIKHSKNEGVGSALRDGFRYALKNNYEIIVVMGGDDQDDATQINCLIEPIKKENCDFVQGSRWINGGKVINIPLFRKVTTKLYSFFFSLITNLSISDGTNGFRAFKSHIFKKIDIDKEWLNSYELEPYIYYQVVTRGFRFKEIPVVKKYPFKKIGYTKMFPFLDWWKILRPLIFLRLGLKK